MQNLPNIEKSAFRHGEYVGYGGGNVWKIKRDPSSGWWRMVAQYPQLLNAGNYSARTLRLLSDKLAQFDKADAMIRAAQTA